MLFHFLHPQHNSPVERGQTQCQNKVHASYNGMRTNVGRLQSSQLLIGS